jgi:hypothetical protein
VGSRLRAIADADDSDEIMADEKLADWLALHDTIDGPAVAAMLSDVR